MDGFIKEQLLKLMADFNSSTSFLEKNKILLLLNNFHDEVRDFGKLKKFAIEPSIVSAISKAPDGVALKFKIENDPITFDKIKNILLALPETDHRIICFPLVKLPTELKEPTKFMVFQKVTDEDMKQDVILIKVEGGDTELKYLCDSLKHIESSFIREPIKIMTDAKEKLKEIISGQIDVSENSNKPK